MNTTIDTEFSEDASQQGNLGEMVKEYLANKFVYAVGGSWMVKADLISAGKFDEITALAREAVALAKS